VECFDLDTFTNGEGFAMVGLLVDMCTVFAANDWDVVSLQNFCIPSSMVMMTEAISAMHHS
jgi:hypothetical protein